MAGKLATTVVVSDAEHAATTFGPATEVPEWAEALITNPKAWAENPHPVAEDETSTETTSKRTTSRKA